MHKHICLWLSMMLLSGALAPRADGQGVKKSIRTVKLPPSELKTKLIIHGFGETKKKAEENAYANTPAAVRKFMRKTHHGVFSWTPTRRFVQRSLDTEVTKWHERDKDLLKEGIIREHCELTVRITKRGYDRLLRENRRHVLRQEQSERDRVAAVRIVDLAKVLAFLLAGCMLTLLYFRLEETAKGYLTRWVVAGLVCFLVLLAAALAFCR